MRPWRYVLRMAAFRLWLFIASGLSASTLFYLVPLLPGLVVREFFNAITVETTAPSIIWWLLALLAGIGALNMSGLIAAAYFETTLHLYVDALLRKNMLRRVLDHPGARAVPVSPGEAVSRIRADVTVTSNFLSWTLDPVGQVLVLVVGISFLISIDPVLTIGVFLPLLAVITVSRLAGKRIEHYRRANQESLGAVTGLLGEMFGAVQAVKVAGRKNALSITSERSTKCDVRPHSMTSSSTRVCARCRPTWPTSVPASSFSSLPSRFAPASSAWKISRCSSPVLDGSRRS